MITYNHSQLNLQQTPANPSPRATPNPIASRSSNPNLVPGIHCPPAVVHEPVTLTAPLQSPVDPALLQMTTVEKEVVIVDTNPTVADRYRDCLTRAREVSSPYQGRAPIEELVHGLTGDP